MLLTAPAPAAWPRGMRHEGVASSSWTQQSEQHNTSMAMSSATTASSSASCSSMRSGLSSARVPATRATAPAAACSTPSHQRRLWGSGAGLLPQRPQLGSGLAPCAFPCVALRPAQRSVAARALFDDERNSKDIGDRIIASLPYLLPLLDAIPFGERLERRRWRGGTSFHSASGSVLKGRSPIHTTCPCAHAGKFIFLEFPFVARAMAPLGPLASLYNGIPFAP